MLSIRLTRAQWLAVMKEYGKIFTNQMWFKSRGRSELCELLRRNQFSTLLISFMIVSAPENLPFLIVFAAKSGATFSSGGDPEMSTYWWGLTASHEILYFYMLYLFGPGPPMLWGKGMRSRSWCVSVHFRLRNLGCLRMSLDPKSSMWRGLGLTTAKENFEEHSTIFIQNEPQSGL